MSSLLPDRPALPALPLVLLVALVGALVGAVPASAQAAPSATVLTLQPVGRPLVDERVGLVATLTRADTGEPVVDRQVTVERRQGEGWRVLARGTTDARGTVTTAMVVRPRAANDVVRATFEGTAELEAARARLAVEPLKRRTVLRLRAPGSVVDGRAVRLRMRWRSGDGRPVAGAGVVQKRVGAGPWRRAARVRFDERGVARLVVRPRHDTRWRAVGRAGRWWQRDVSGVRRIDNLPPGEPVAYPAGAPRPRVRLPRPERAVGAGPHGVVRRIPDGVWRSMVGRSWHAGCPVGRGDLRLVRTNFWGYDGYRYRGELVVRADIARRTVGVFADLYRARLPVRSIYRVDRFGWSDTLGGADNYASMASGNTSAFNCRGVVGNPSTRSPHSYGRAIDLNTWENPYHSRTGVVPNTWWASRSHPRIAWRSPDHRVVRIMRDNGFRWTYGTSDAHHFDG